MAKLLEKSLVQAEFARQLFRVTPPVGTNLDDMLEPSYWANVAMKFNPHDLIEVVPEDGAFYARLFVLSVQKLSLKVEKLEYVEFNTSSKAESGKVLEQFESKWGGASAKWRIHRKSDNAPVSSDSFQSKEDAEDWLGKNIKTLAA